MPEASLFNPDVNGYYLDWYDTEESERLLRFQHHSFDQIKAAMAKRFCVLRPLIRALAAFIMRWLEQMSPRYLRTDRGDVRGVRGEVRGDEEVL